MKQGVIYLLILIGGIGIGYIFNLLFNAPTENETETEKVIVQKVKKKIIRDTVQVERIVYTSTVDTSNIAESLEYADSLDYAYDEESNQYYSSEESEEIIIKEELISQRTISLAPPKNDSTDVSKLLDLKSNAFSNEIIVEFWQSPLNITGYELSRNKLKLFGFNPNESISLHLGTNEDQLFLNTDSMSLLLQKTKQFKTLKLK
ncbi:MAG TPA: hypothetical protein VFD77_01045 [Brumimicrobium sp.]|nr:hypothetical protein [Brumimicrobium sp.]